MSHEKKMRTRMARVDRARTRLAAAQRVVALEERELEKAVMAFEIHRRPGCDAHLRVRRA